MIPIAAGIAVFVFMALFVYALVKGTKDFDRLREQILDQFAIENGFEFGDASRFDLREKIRNFAIIGVAENKIVHAAWKEQEGVRFYVFDQVRVTRGGSSTRGGLLTICLVEARSQGLDTVIFSTANRMEAKLSRKMTGKRLGLAPVTTGDPDFDNRFVLFSQSPSMVLRMLDCGLKNLLVTEANKISLPLMIQIRENGIVVHNTGDRPKTIKNVDEIRTLVNLAKWVLDTLSADIGTN